MKGKGKRSSAQGAKNSQNIKLQLKNLGDRIRQIRIQKGYSSYEYFAYEHNFSRAQFGRYEKGQDLRFSTLVRITDAFGISLDEFFGTGFEKSGKKS